MTFGERIKDIRKKLKLTQEALSEAINVSRVTVSAWETGDNVPSMDKLYSLAAALNTTVAYLMGETDDPCAKSQQPADPDAISPSSVHEAAEQYIFVPILEMRSCAGMGNGYADIQWDAKGQYPIRKSDVIGYTWQGGALKIIGIDGSSMEPKFHDGDNVLFTTNLEMLRSGDIVVVVWDGRIYIRGYFNDEEGLTLKPMNPIVPDLHINKGDERLTIVGKVIARVPRLEKELGFYA